jgi:two-component system cell cycle sensor histidine kinase/response regulator CckA
MSPATARRDACVESESLYRAIVENASDLILTVGLDGNILGVNAAFERVLGYTREELVGSPFASLVGPAWRAQTEDAVEAKLAGRLERTVYDAELVARDGRHVPVEVSSWLVYEGGEPVAAQAICRDVTERNDSERALRIAQDALFEREDLLQRAFENTAIGMLLFSSSGSIITPNLAFCHLLGYSADELRALDIFSITHPDDRAEVADVLPRLVTGELPRLSTEKRYLHKNGEPVWAQVGVSPVRNSAGEVKTLIAQVVDITGRREADEALRDSEELFRTAFEGAAIGKLMATPQGNIIRANAALCDLLGYEQAELRRLDVVELTHPADRAETAAAVADILAGTVDSFAAEKRYLRKDGEAVWVQVSASPVRGRDGNVRCYVTQVVDLTERRAVEERFRLLFESSPHGMDIVDSNRKMLRANAALTRMLGYDRKELLELRFEDFTHPDDWRPDVDLFAEMVNGRRSYYELDKRLVRRDGQVIWAHLTSFALPDVGPTPRFIIGILEDITERRELEERLRQSQRMEAIGQLAGGVAHDFNNLLTAIVSYCDLAAGAIADDADARVAGSVRGIRAAADRAADLTRQLLAFSRRQVLELAAIDMNEIVADHAPMLRRLIGDDLDIRLELAPDASAVTMDAGQLVQVLVNLAVNARDAMPEGGTLTIETENVVLDRAPTTTGTISGPHVLLAVSDTGFGMDAATVARIFEPFFTTKEPGKGTGLGLATVLGIVEQSGGRVAVYSEPDVGTTVKVYLPSADAEAAQAPAVAVAAASSDRPVGRERILLVEDNDSVRGPIADVLADLGYGVLAAARPDDALEAADGEDVDLLVTDVVMPAMNGRQLAEALLADRPGMKVLYISGYTDDAVIAAGAIEPGVAFLQKPFGADRLAQKIRELLDA